MKQKYNVPLILVLVFWLNEYAFLSLTNTPNSGIACSNLLLAFAIILCGALAWGVKSVILAVAAAVVSLPGYAVHPRPGGLWFELLRAVSFVAVALLAGGLRDRYVATRAALAMSEGKYRQLVEKALAGIFIYRNDQVLYANSRFKEIVGYAPEEVVGKPFWDFIYDKDRASVREQLARREKEGLVDLQYECRLVAKDGRIVWTDVVSSPVDHEGQPAVLVSVYNITTQKEIEERRRDLSMLARKQEDQLVHSTRLAEMGEMAAGVAHELNQPLTGIKNFAKNALYMIEEGAGSTEDIKENLRMIAGQVDRAARIISQMRELARRTERHVGWVDINGTLRESVEFVTPQLRLSGVDVTTYFAEDLPQVMGDRIRLEQVFLNLLTNARQAMDDRAERRLEVRTRYERGSEVPVVIAITDTGKGFPPDVAGKLFTPFFSTKKAGYGTGLGLSISLSIIKDHKGTIEATGAEGKGAVFTVRLPIRPEGFEVEDAKET